VADHSGVELQHVQPRLLGWIPPLALLGAGGTLFLAAIAFLATAHWVLAPFLLVLALGLLGLYVVAASRLPRTEAARRAASGVWRARDELRFAGSSVAAWGSAGGQVLKRQRELRRLGRERDTVQHALGGAVHAGDEAATAELRARMHDLEAQMTACAEAILAARREAEARVSQARMPLSSTEIVTPGRPVRRA
jgi:hypothetical protein